MVSAIVPMMHQVPRDMLLSTNEVTLTKHFLGLLEPVPDTTALLTNNPLKKANWSLNRDILHATFTFPIDDALCAAAHHVFRSFSMSRMTPNLNSLNAPLFPASNGHTSHVMTPITRRSANDSSLIRSYIRAYLQN